MLGDVLNELPKIGKPSVALVGGIQQQLGTVEINDLESDCHPSRQHASDIFR